MLSHPFLIVVVVFFRGGGGGVQIGLEPSPDWSLFGGIMQISDNRSYARLRQILKIHHQASFA